MKRISLGEKITKFKKIKRATILFFLFPSLFTEEKSKWADFNLANWSREQYQWKQDPWNGFLDYVSKPQNVIDGGGGDCDDYALLASSCLKSRHEEVQIAFCWNWKFNMHMVAFTEQEVYSSGSIIQKQIGDYISESEYTNYITREID